MSQVFSGDAVNNTTSTTVTGTTETAVATGNFVNPPFGNAKAIVQAQVSLTVGTGQTSVTLRLRRNPTGENTQIATSGAVTVAAGNTVLVGLSAADAIPDGRPCQYGLTVAQAGGGGNGTALFASVATILISG